MGLSALCGGEFLLSRVQTERAPSVSCYTSGKDLSQPFKRQGLGEPQFAQDVLCAKSLAWEVLGSVSSCHPQSDSDSRSAASLTFSWMN